MGERKNIGNVKEGIGREMRWDYGRGKGYMGWDRNG